MPTAGLMYPSEQIRQKNDRQPMNADLLLVLLMLGAAILMFAVNRPRVDAVALLAMVALPFTGVITVNGRSIDDYFGLETLKVIVRQPLVATGTVDKVDVEATVTGGGVSGQAGAIRHGIARALLVVDAAYRPALKSAGFLTRDPRMKERKKYGLKAARRAPQFSKR